MNIYEFYHILCEIAIEKFSQILFESGVKRENRFYGSGCYSLLRRSRFFDII